METTNKSGMGSIIGTIIIIALIILGGLYFWGKRIEETKSNQNAMTGEEAPMQVNEATAIKSISTSDDISSIDADLKATNLDNLSKEVTQ